jgi:hypothetical protein
MQQISEPVTSGLLIEPRSHKIFSLRFPKKDRATGLSVERIPDRSGILMCTKKNKRKKTL